MKHKTHVIVKWRYQITCTFDPITKETVHYKIMHRTDKRKWMRKGCVDDS